MRRGRHARLTGTGVYVSAPCLGARLTPLTVEENDGARWCLGVAR